MRRSVLIPLLFILCYCNNPQDEKGKTAPAKDERPPAVTDDISGCYMRVIARDSFVAHLKQQGELITGQLTFDNFEKDGSTGSVTGRIRNGILQLVYSFESEGTSSVMDVYFRKEGDALIRGIGEINTRGDTAYYTKPDSLDYPQAEKLLKVPCESLPEKFWKGR